LLLFISESFAFPLPT